MDHLLLGTAANKVHDRSLQASATQKWAASTTTEALADAFDDDDALSELRQTPALTQDAASLASKVSDATAARLAHRFMVICPQKDQIGPQGPKNLHMQIQKSGQKRAPRARHDKLRESPSSLHLGGGHMDSHEMGHWLRR